MTAASYDGDGLRATATYGASTQDFVWNDVTSLPQVLMDSGNAYIYTSGVAPAEQVNLATGTVTYLVTDSLGSVRGTVSGTGTLTATTSYDAWGNPETTGGLTASTPYGYAGGYTDATGLEYLINRYYDPATGQFTSVDPALAQTQQPYAYADGNPVSNADPDGRCWWGWKCWRSFAVNTAVTLAFLGITTLVMVLCAGVTGGVCSGFWYYVYSATMGGTSAVMACWWSGSCRNASDFARAALGGIIIGLASGWVSNFLGMNLAKLNIIRAKLWSHILYIVWGAWIYLRS
jgi:RHS repeat-associated protein